MIFVKYIIALNMFTVIVALWHTQQREITPQYTPYFVYSSYRACIEYVTVARSPQRLSDVEDRKKKLTTTAETC